MQAVASRFEPTDEARMSSGATATRAISVWAGLGLLVAGAAHGGVLSGPILDEGLTAVLEDVVQMPASAPSRPLARVNGLREAPDGSGRLFVNDLEGFLYVLDGGIQLYLDLGARIPGLKTSPSLATGFVSFAFHPEFATNGLFYTVHTEHVGSTPPNLEPPLPITAIHHAVLTEWRATDPTADAFAGTSRELLRIPAPHLFHNLGEIDFDPTALPGDPDYGLLYVTAGDFGSVELGQPGQLGRLDSPYGALLRIDPLGGPFVRGGVTYGYGIPASNPHAGSPDPDVLGEILAVGFRNPHRLVWDPVTRELFVADVGQGNLEEIDRIVHGANYGWPVREGTYALDVTTDPEAVLPLPPGDAGFTYPVAQYDHAEGAAVAGGAVLRVPGTELVEHLVFGDIVNGRIFYAPLSELLKSDDGNAATTAAVHELHLRHAGVERTLSQVVAAALGLPAVDRVDLRFAQDRAGTVYVTTKQDGFVRRLVPLPRCDDGADNDGDGRSDYLAAGGGDPGCLNPNSPTENPQCQDGLNNDNAAGIDFDGGASLDIDPRDGLIDAHFNPATPEVGEADPQCVGKPYRNREAPTPKHCGLGAELALVTPLLGLAANRRRRAS
jgi:glucose/arabinose dehydrogenase